MHLDGKKDRHIKEAMDTVLVKTIFMGFYDCNRLQANYDYNKGSMFSGEKNKK